MRRCAILSLHALCLRKPPQSLQFRRREGMGLERLLTIGAALAILVVFVVVVLSPPSRDRRPPPPSAGSVADGTPPALRPSLPVTPEPAAELMGGPVAGPAAPVSENCASPPERGYAASENGASLTEREWSPWGRPERGWETYLPLVAKEIGTACPAGSPGFAAALARWQGGRKLDANGVLTAPSFELMRVTWLRRRPFVAAFSKGQCPAGADEAALAPATKQEGYSGKPILLQPGALAAYRAMVKAAREEAPEVEADHRLLTIFSGYRAPAADEARCDAELSCGTLTRARCSAHRTGTALDIYVGEAPGSRPESSDDANRLFQSRSAVYRWLVANGARFGFVPYPFEPWHWEWAGEGVEAAR